jgi:quinol-cytochrome oxidoreductase complex cytochrome b subunit
VKDAEYNSHLPKLSYFLLDLHQFLAHFFVKNCSTKDLFYGIFKRWREPLSVVAHAIYVLNSA